MNYVDESGLAARTCTVPECEKCAKDALKNDDFIKEFLKLLRKTVPLLPLLNIDARVRWKPGCKPDVFCSNECALNDLGKYGTYNGKKRIKLCNQSYPNFGTYPPNDPRGKRPNEKNPKGPKIPRGACDAVIETLRHELVHLHADCVNFNNGGNGPCEQCICEELNAYSLSGQCDEGSVFRDVLYPQQRPGESFDNKAECLARSAVNSCEGHCGLLTDEQKDALGSNTAPKCKGTVKNNFTNPKK